MTDEPRVAPLDETSIVLVGSNFHTFDHTVTLESFDSIEDRLAFPFNVTLGFRDNFWRVFSRLSLHGRGPHAFTWLEHQWELDSLWATESNDVDFAQQLEDPVNVFLVFVLRPKRKIEKPLRDLIFEQGLNEQTAIAQLAAAFAGTTHAAFISTFKHRRTLNALFTWDTPPIGVTTSNLVALFSFNSFALLMIWKITREQTQIRLLPEGKGFRKQLNALLRLRTHIINIEQLVLTHNVSNDPAIKRVAGSMRQRFGLRSKLQNLLPLNEAIQRYFDTISQLRGDRSSTMLNAIAFCIAAVGLPVSLMSMFLAINDTAPVIGRGVRYLGTVPILYFFAGTALLSATLLVVAAGLVFGAIRVRQRT